MLARAAAFLPQLAEANKKLEERIGREGREAVDIEAVPAGAAHIEMVPS